jgi:hypothetical protein
MHRVVIFLIINVLSISSLVFAQNPNYMFDEKSGHEIIYGKCTIDHLKSGIFGDYLSLEYPNYIPNPEIIERINSILAESKNVRIKVVLATWCGDSKDQVPRFFKMIDEISNSKIQISEIICLDRAKTAPDFDNKKYKIERVPTFIIYQGVKEMGRIVETPQISLEEDFLQILLNQ